MPKCTYQLWVPEQGAEGHETMSTIPITNMPECMTYLLWVPWQDAKWAWNHKHHSNYQHARMHNSLTISSRAGHRMDMKPWAPLWSIICQNAQLTSYKCQGRMQNGHETMSTIPVINMPECMTHLLWVSWQDAEWAWNHEHHSHHQHARMHNSLTMSARARQRMDMKPWAPFQSPICKNAQLTSYECQGRMQNGHETMSTIWNQSPTCQNAQLTSY